MNIAYRSSSASINVALAPSTGRHTQVTNRVTQNGVEKQSQKDPQQKMKIHKYISTGKY